MQGFLHRFSLLRTELTHDFLQIDANSPGSRSFLIELPVGELASSDASLSALSLPVIPQWLGIQYNEVAVPLDLRHLIWFLIGSVFWGTGGIVKL